MQVENELTTSKTNTKNDQTINSPQNTTRQDLTNTRCSGRVNISCFPYCTCVIGSSCSIILYISNRNQLSPNIYLLGLSYYICFSGIFHVIIMFLIKSFQNYLKVWCSHWLNMVLVLGVIKSFFY